MGESRRADCAAEFRHLALTEGKVADIRFSAKEVISSADLDKPEGLLDQCVTSILQKDVHHPRRRRCSSESALPQMGGQDRQSQQADRARDWIAGISTQIKPPFV